MAKGAALADQARTGSEVRPFVASPFGDGDPLTDHANMSTDAEREPLLTTTPRDASADRNGRQKPGTVLQTAAMRISLSRDN